YFTAFLGKFCCFLGGKKRPTGPDPGADMGQRPGPYFSVALTCEIQAGIVPVNQGQAVAADPVFMFVSNDFSYRAIDIENIFIVDHKITGADLVLIDAKKDCSILQKF